MYTRASDKTITGGRRRHRRVLTRSIDAPAAVPRRDGAAPGPRRGARARRSPDRFPYYKANDERWKNSVRHNLSINPHFRKGARAPQGAGHLWSLAANAIDLLPPRNTTVFLNEKTEDVDSLRVADLISCPKVIVLDEAAIAAASILPDQDVFSGNTMFLNPVSSEQVVRESGLLTVD
ncbi:Hepatocyte nuclear factor 3-beta [Eumeta japonica]|uniref:Hepatocyte nuclear factor 3-beta n=1 Tax=Eumeta variegata TaxID=151549 RepID=A0A4C1YVU8_EUMVA|nr:Hepatocyte nuclear factor 3-beta [Eumeta japonica]